MNAPAAGVGPRPEIVGCYRARGRRWERVSIALPALVMRIGSALVFWRSGQASCLRKIPSHVVSRGICAAALPPELAAYLATEPSN